ncbi:hypothetical protein N9948_01090, partial [bacterium]|nr:hypothetical protein [bacterium]
MRNRLTKQAMGKDDSPTTMDVDQVNPDVSKYETGNPESWAEGVNMDSPWDAENAPGGREDTGHAKKVRDGGAHNTYASAVREAQDLEAKALRCLKMAEVMLGEDSPTDAIERQAVDFMTMSTKSVLATLRRMREFEENISEAKVAKIVDAVLEVIAEDDGEDAAEEKAHEKAEKDEEKADSEGKKAEKDEKEEEMKEEKCASEEDEDAKIAAIVQATLDVIAEEEDDAKKEKEDEAEE